MIENKPIIYYKKDCFNEPYCSLKEVLEELSRKTKECEKWKNVYEVKEAALEEAEEYTEELEEKYHKLQEQLHRYKQAIEEIKEILQNEHPFVDCSCRQDLLQIIQKCEV